MTRDGPVSAHERDARLDARRELVVLLDGLEVAHRLEAQQDRVVHLDDARVRLCTKPAQLALEHRRVARLRLRDERGFGRAQLVLAGGELRERRRNEVQVALGADREEVVLDVRVEERERARGRFEASRVALGQSNLRVRSDELDTRW